MFIQWPTIVTAAMWPILMFMYYRLALREEKEMESAFGDRFADYKRQVPMFLPRVGKARVTA
jgi:protein-S-isoprenylcysteine O-methyltransferase Ste14